jgi:hypothetical protein
MLTAPVLAGEQGEQNEGPVVSTAEGPVSGVVENGVYKFLGVPYAAPPVGALRWTPPQPVQHWSEVRKATKFAGTCAQVTELGVFAPRSAEATEAMAKARGTRSWSGFTVAAMSMARRTTMTPPSSPPVDRKGFPRWS